MRSVRVLPAVEEQHALDSGSVRADHGLDVVESPPGVWRAVRRQHAAFPPSVAPIRGNPFLDAATAVAVALEKRDACLKQTFNICDDEPVLAGTYLDYIAARLESRSPFHIPRWLAKLMVGASLVDALLASVRCHNARFKEMTGWEPEYPNYREGIAAEVDKWQAMTRT